MNTVKLTNVTKIIKKRTILSNINLTLEKGNIYGLYGRNGSGKTMLIRIISGLILPSSGTVEVFGQRIGKDVSFPQSMGLTIENVGFWPRYTGIECLELLASIKHEINTEQIREALKTVGLDPDDKRKYYQYSLGMKQKLAIAQALMENPELILLDEPTNSLDEESVLEVKKILMREKERGALIVIASHNKEDIHQLADKVIMINDGQITKMEVVLK